MLTHKSILTTGRYKFTRLDRVPPDYLLNVYKHKNSDIDLLEYIESNLEFIIAKKNGEIIPEELKLCNKICYATEKIAKNVLNDIAPLKQKHKKPIRSYQCEKCGGYHLTSLPLDQWMH